MDQGGDWSSFTYIEITLKKTQMISYNASRNIEEKNIIRDKIWNKGYVMIRITRQ